MVLFGTVALLLAACATPGAIQLENALLKPDLLFEKYTNNGRVQLERTLLSRTGYLLIDRYLINTEGYSNIGILKDMTEVQPSGGQPGYTVLIGRGKTADCDVKSFTVSFTRRHFSLQELPGCNVDYAFADMPTRQGVVRTIVGRAGEDVGRYALESFGQISLLQPPVQAPAQTPARPTVASTSPSAPISGAPASAAPGRAARPQRSVTRAPAPEPEEAKPVALPSETRRTTFRDLPPPRAGDFTPDLKKPEYDATKEKS